MEVVPMGDFKLLVETRAPPPSDIAFINTATSGAAPKVTAYDFSIYAGSKATVSSANSIYDKNEKQLTVIVQTKRAS